MAKGFDTISHNILLHKVSFYGFDSNSINFFTSYLSNRCQKVKCGSLISKENSIEIGIPQGSILGPILFIIYVNDFSSCFKNINCIEYADDTTLECSGNTLAVVEKRLQNNVNNASNWLFKNNLIVNAKNLTLVQL